MRVMAGRALAVPFIVVLPFGWNCLMTICASGPRETMRLVARLALVAMRAGLDSGNLGPMTIGAAFPPASPDWSRVFVGLMAICAFVRPSLGGSRFRRMAIVTTLDVGNLMVLVTIDARPCVRRTGGP